MLSGKSSLPSPLGAVQNRLNIPPRYDLCLRVNVSGPSSLAQAVQVGCRQHPYFLSLSLWGNKVDPPFPLSLARSLSAHSFSSTLTCVDLRMTGQSSSPRGRGKESEREKERERVKKPCHDCLCTGSGRKIYCLQGTKNHCRTHFYTCIRRCTHEHVPRHTLSQCS